MFNSFIFLKILKIISIYFNKLFFLLTNIPFFKYKGQGLLNCYDVIFGNNRWEMIDQSSVHKNSHQIHFVNCKKCYETFF